MEEQKLTIKHQSGLFKYKFNKPCTENLEIHAPIVRVARSKLFGRYAPNFLDGTLQTFWRIRCRHFGRGIPQFWDNSVQRIGKRCSKCFGAGKPRFGNQVIRKFE